MKRSVPVESASAFIDKKIKDRSCQPGGGDWRGKTLAKVRAIIHETAPEIVEERKWEPKSLRTPVFSHGGIICTGETHKNVVMMTFAKGTALEDPSGLFNSSLDWNVRRAIDIHEGGKIDEAALKDLIRAAVRLNLSIHSAQNAARPKDGSVKLGPLGRARRFALKVSLKPKPRRASSNRAG
jgi:hypothetical protein